MDIQTQLIAAILLFVKCRLAQGDFALRDDERAPLLGKAIGRVHNRSAPLGELY